MAGSIKLYMTYIIGPVWIWILYHDTMIGCYLQITFVSVWMLNDFASRKFYKFLGWSAVPLKFITQNFQFQKYLFKATTSLITSMRRTQINIAYKYASLWKILIAFVRMRVKLILCQQSQSSKNSFNLNISTKIQNKTASDFRKGINI